MLNKSKKKLDFNSLLKSKHENTHVFPWSADDQCKMLYGEDAIFCRVNQTNYLD